jgi:hypothetical protein
VTREIEGPRRLLTYASPTTKPAETGVAVSSSSAAQHGNWRRVMGGSFVEGVHPRLDRAGAGHASEMRLRFATDQYQSTIDCHHNAGLEKPWLSRRGRRIDFAERDAANRRLSKLGEEFAVNVERHRLRKVRRDDLAAKVEWVAETIGDGLGFDVLSFDECDDSEKRVEVKTTTLGKFFPFYVTINEVRCSEDVPEQFHLFRVFDFTRNPRVYVMTGSLSVNCRLEPRLFLAAI